MVTASALAYFVAIGLLIPVLPLYVEGPLGGGGMAIGVAVGAFSFSAALVRPAVGRLGDRAGRRLLVMGGALLVGLSTAGYGLAHGLAPLLALRLVTGLGEAAVFVGAATAVQDLAPAARRGEAASYFSVAIYGGLAVGPVLGESLQRAAGFGAVWLSAGACCLLAAALGWWTPAAPTEGVASGSADRRVLHPAALLPGSVLGLSLIGFAGFSAFLPLYVSQVGLGGSRFVFGLYAVIVLVVRLFGARIPDTAGPVPTATAALVALASGLLTMALWRSAAGLLSGTVLFAVGMSLLFPSLLRLVIDATPAPERSSAVATFSLFFDLAHGVGALMLGAVVAVAGEAASFGVSAMAAVAGLVVLRRIVAAPARLAERLA
jgi:MFS family permease